MKVKNIIILFLFLNFYSFSSYEKKCVLKYNFDEKSKIVKDISGNGNDGEIIEAEYCSGVNKSGIYFNGKGACVRIPLSNSLKKFDEITIEMWISPEIIRHSGVFWASETTDFSKQSKAPIRFEWRGPSWFFWLSLTTEDGENRLIQPQKPSIEYITFPNPTWYYVVATYDGNTGKIYLNGEKVAERKWEIKKSIAEIKQPILLGSAYLDWWNSFKGKVDEVAIYNYSLTEEEILKHYSFRESYKQEKFEKTYPGTIDGKPYFPIGYSEKWLSFPLSPYQRGTVHFSNTGEISIQAGSGWSGSYELGILGLWGQPGRGEKFYREVDGFIKLTPPDKEDVFTLEGITYNGMKIKQEVVITPDNEIRFSYHFYITDKNNEIMPTILWPIHLWPSALSFVGYEKGKLVKGRIIDLDRTAYFEDTLEVNLSRGRNRFILKLAPDLVFQLNGDRNPINWIQGWTTYSGMIKKKITNEKLPTEEVFNFSIKIVDDALPPLLDEAKAEEITKELPFDFTQLYEKNPEKPYIKPADREVPIFGIDEDIKLIFGFPVPSILKNYPLYKFVVEEAYSQKKVFEMEGKVSDPWWDWVGSVSLNFSEPSVYVATLEFFDNNGNLIDSVSQELAVAGPIEQKELKIGEPIKMKLVDSVDFTKENPGHNFYSCSGKSRIEKINGIKYRRTLSLEEMRQMGLQIRDWFGCTLMMKNPKRDHIVEVVYADIDDTIVGINILEPLSPEGKDSKTCLTRVSTGIITGGFYEASNKLKKFKTVYIPTGNSPWCAITFINLYKNPIGIASVNLYELPEGLPRLPKMSNERIFGVHTESGDVGIGTFGYNELAGEFCPRVPFERFYREHYRAIVNLIRYMRFTGENVYNFGVYRYRNALFPSKYIGSGIPFRTLDFPALMAKMFEYNDLKIMMNVAPCNPLPIARLYRYSTYDLIKGAPVARQVSFDGEMDAGHFGYQPANPFHPEVQKEYQKLAEELAERYGKYKSFVGISWLCGGAGLGEPSIFQWGYRIKKGDEKGFNDFFFKYTYDDITMREFEEYAGIKLPGKEGESDRFKKRYEFIMKDEKIKEKWIEFRCFKMAEIHRKFKEAFCEKAPGKKYFLIDYYGISLNNEFSVSPSELVRLSCGGPKYYKNIEGLVYCPYIPTIDGSQFKEYAHGLMPEEWIPNIINFVKDEEFAKECDTGIETGKYLHRQFFETFTIANPDREWVFTHCKHLPGRKNYLAHNTYPQPNGNDWFADFVLLFRYSTPSFISYMWCDGSFPLGHFEEKQKFAILYRSLPMGEYKTIIKENGVFVRMGEHAFYIIETEGKGKEFSIDKNLISGVYRDALTGELLKSKKDKYYFILSPYDFKVYLKEIEK